MQYVICNVQSALCVVMFYDMCGVWCMLWGVICVMCSVIVVLQFLVLCGVYGICDV